MMPAIERHRTALKRVLATLAARAGARTPPPSPLRGAAPVAPSRSRGAAAGHCGCEGHTPHPASLPTRGRETFTPRFSWQPKRPRTVMVGPSRPSAFLHRQGASPEVDARHKAGHDGRVCVPRADARC